jgi:hypothetical protein
MPHRTNPKVKRKATRSRASETPRPEPAGETKRARFLRIGEARVNRAINSIRLLGNLANPNYEWEPGDIDTIQRTIVDALGKALGRFDRKQPRQAQAFKFVPAERSHQH